MTQQDKKPRIINLSLTVKEPDLVEELARYDEGPARSEYALAALRIGMQAIMRAQGQLDADLIRREADMLVTRMSAALGNFFDPRTGSFNQRVEQLLKKDGDMETALKALVGAENSELARTLAAHIGENSPFMKLLSTDESEGFLKALAETIESRLDEQGEKILDEFTLDNEESALSRLVKKVESSQESITGEFSLDNKESALSRMRDELLEILLAEQETNQSFRASVTAGLAALAAKREEKNRSTRHGDDFERDVFAFVRHESQGAGDIAEHVGSRVGLIKNCKTGDCTVQVGPEAEAAGARIAIEAKEKQGYTLELALKEIEEARKNRAAEVGLFVFSKKTAPGGLLPFSRYGNDIVVTWDAEDEATDSYLSAGLSVARALCTKAAVQRKSSQVDFKAITTAIRHVEKQVAGLEEIKTQADTITGAVTKIVSRAGTMKSNLVRMVGQLDNEVDNIRAAMKGAGRGGKKSG